MRREASISAITASGGIGPRPGRDARNNAQADRRPARTPSTGEQDPPSAAACAAAARTERPTSAPDTARPRGWHQGRACPGGCCSGVAALFHEGNPGRTSARQRSEEARSGDSTHAEQGRFQTGGVLWCPPGRAGGRQGRHCDPPSGARQESAGTGVECGSADRSCHGYYGTSR